MTTAATTSAAAPGVRPARRVVARVAGRSDAGLVGHADEHGRGAAGGGGDGRGPRAAPELSCHHRPVDQEESALRIDPEEAAGARLRLRLDWRTFVWLTLAVLGALALLALLPQHDDDAHPHRRRAAHRPRPRPTRRQAAATVLDAPGVRRGDRRHRGPLPRRAAGAGARATRRRRGPQVLRAAAEDGRRARRPAARRRLGPRQRRRPEGAGLDQRPARASSPTSGSPRSPARS